jgi:hypothetical protein
MHDKLSNFIDKENKRSLYLLLFLVCWFGINLIQSALTELLHDEAYYWMYSQHLAWGYFDHPPMIALLIKIGYWIFPSAFGVRLLTSLMGTATVFIIYLIIDEERKSLFLFILITCSIILVHSHVGGYLAIPDIPLLFFTSLFFLVYRRYHEKDSIGLAVLLSVIAALMLYSKYHAVLVLIFTLSANIHLVRRKSFWLIPLLTGIILLPHLIWQIKNGFPSLEYHLISRSSAYRFDHTFNYLYSQLLIAGPFVAVIILYQAFGYRVKSEYDKVMKVNLIGVMLFFFLSSFKGHVEAHWTAIAYIPMLFLAYKGSAHSPLAITWLKRLFLPSILLFAFIRILLVEDIFDNKISTLKEVHKWDKWAKQIDSLAKGRMVVFVNSFQRPAKYSFYTGGKIAQTLNNIYYRRNQYDIWRFEDSLQHKPVLLLNSRAPSDTINMINGEKYPYELVSDFVSYNNLGIKCGITKLYADKGTKVPIEVTIYNPRGEDIIFRKGDRLVITFFKGKHAVKSVRVFSLDAIKLRSNNSVKLDLAVPVPEMQDNLDMYISIATANLLPAINRPPVKVILK